MKIRNKINIQIRDVHGNGKCGTPIRYFSRGIPMGMGTKLLKLMGLGREWEWLRWKWKRLLLMSSHLIITYPPKSVYDLIDLEFYIIFFPFCC